MTDDFMGDIYKDFFGPGSGGDGKPPVFDDPKQEESIRRKVSRDFDKLKEGNDPIGPKYPEDKNILADMTRRVGNKKQGSEENNSHLDDALEEKTRKYQDANEALEEARNLFNNINKPVPPTPAPTATATGDQVKPEEQKPEEPETDPMDDLNELIGLASIKHDVKELTDFAKVQKLRKDEGMKSVPVSLHLVFTGNPGTGKTTVARIISRIYKQIGVLSKGQLVEVDRSGLVAGYVGQTALKTQEKINQALGGVLFIDEAYSLSQENDAFGQEAIDTILKAMEDHRDDLVVIVAGYTDPMEKFINSNPGLKSRFNKYIEFPDYSVDELEEIFNMNLKKYEYEVEEEAKKHIRQMISTRKLTRLENFANAREIRNLFEEIVTNQARRIAKLENPTAEDIKLIISEDLTDKKNTEEKDEENKTTDENSSESANSEAKEEEKTSEETDNTSDSNENVSE
ncbi:AAA family ATPase [Butyrivibrio sp. VCD2006]|uniref:AAA family ATPase n=1 Tax=Butyrivibrio sp. VCD2006 TaxID=1280664 RepID=UPI0003F7E3F6|nr:AAA family ATPase [Butyrivibrio sp. VCD2006]